MDSDEKQEVAAVADPGAESGRPSGLLTQVTVVGVLLGLALAVLMVGGMFWLGDYYLRESVETPDEEKLGLRELQAADQRELTNYGWINRQQGQVRIPIERAMDLLAEETDANKEPPPTSSGD